MNLGEGTLFFTQIIFILLFGGRFEPVGWSYTEVIAFKIVQSCLYQRSLMETGKERKRCLWQRSKNVAKNAITCLNISLQIAYRETSHEFTIFGRMRGNRFCPPRIPPFRLLWLTIIMCQIASRSSVCIALVSKYLVFSPPFITKCFSSIPYLLVATQV